MHVLKFFDVKGYVIMAVMMGGGVALRSFHLRTLNITNLSGKAAPSTAWFSQRTIPPHALGNQKLRYALRREGLCHHGRYDGRRCGPALFPPGARLVHRVLLHGIALARGYGLDAHAGHLASSDEPHRGRDEQQVLGTGIGFVVHYAHRNGCITCPVTGKVREG